MEKAKRRKNKKTIKTYLNKHSFLLIKVMLMRKIFVLFVLALIVGCSQIDVEEETEEGPLIGESCGTVSPDYRDECCARQNKDTIHIMCVGEWKYNMETGKCEFVCETEEIKENVELANPASTYCEQKGYEIEIRDEADGQAGYCIFPDGNECEEWRFYRGTCGEKYS